METAATATVEGKHRDFSEITLDPISLHAWLPLMESRLKKETLFLSLFDLWWCSSPLSLSAPRPGLVWLGIFLLKLFSQECICYTSMARKRSAFKEVSLFNMGLFCMVWVHRHPDGFHGYEIFPICFCFCFISSISHRAWMVQARHFLKCKFSKPKVLFWIAQKTYNWQYRAGFGGLSICTLYFFTCN